MPADAGRHLQPGRAQLLRDQPGRLPLLAGELGLAVDRPAKLDQLFLLWCHVAKVAKRLPVRNWVSRRRRLTRDQGWQSR
jgi:hypothetical protein